MIRSPGVRGCTRKGCGGVGSLRTASRCRSHGRGRCAWHSRGGGWCASERSHARLCFGRNRDTARPCRTRRQGGMMIKQPGDRGCARKGCGGVGSLRAARRCRSHGRGGCAWHSRGGGRAWCASERNHARLCFGRNRDGGRPRRVWRQGGRMIQRPGIGGCTRKGCGGVGSLRAASRCQSDGRGGCSWYSRGGGWNRNGGRPCPARQGGRMTQRPGSHQRCDAMDRRRRRCAGRRRLERPAIDARDHSGRQGGCGQRPALSLVDDGHVVDGDPLNGGRRRT